MQATRKAEIEAALDGREPTPTELWKAATRELWAEVKGLERQRDILRAALLEISSQGVTMPGLVGEWDAASRAWADARNVSADIANRALTTIEKPEDAHDDTPTQG